MSISTGISVCIGLIIHIPGIAIASAYQYILLIFLRLWQDSEGHIVYYTIAVCFNKLIRSCQLVLLCYSMVITPNYLISPSKWQL